MYNKKYYPGVVVKYNLEHTDHRSCVGLHFAAAVVILDP
jgi:hypothetical protein